MDQAAALAVARFRMAGMDHSALVVADHQVVAVLLVMAVLEAVAVVVVAVLLAVAVLVAAAVEIKQPMETMLGVLLVAAVVQQLEQHLRVVKAA